MQVQIVIYDASYSTVLTDGPVFCTSARVERMLDRLGRCSVDIPASQTRALAQIDSRRVIEVWVYPDVNEYERDGARARKLGAFVVQEFALRESAGELVYSVSGVGTMQKLKDTITLPNLTYDNQTVSAILTSLAGLAGWTASNAAALSSLNMSARFQGESVMKAYQFVCETQGVHFRESSSASATVEAGAFGADNGLSIQSAPADLSEGATSADSPLWIERVEILEQSAEIVNWVLPFGAGNGDAALSLVDSTRGGISSTSANGRTHYYITDAASVSSYGTIQKRMNFKQIVQIGETPTQRQRAANALYDAAYQWLQRHKDPYQSLKVTARNVHENIEVGDKIHVFYQGWVERPDSGRYQYADIDALYWVMGCVESVTNDGVSVSLTLATADRHETNAAGLVVGALDALDVQQVHQQTMVNAYKDQLGARVVSNSTDGVFNLKIYEGFYKARRIILELERSAIVTHQHQVLRHVDEAVNAPKAVAPSLMAGEVLDVSAGTTSTKHLVALTNFGVGEAWLTTPSSDEYGSALSIKPEDVDVSVGVTSVATGLFTGVDDTASVDITSQITQSGDYEITVECTGSGTYGWINVNVYIEYEQASVWSA